MTHYDINLRVHPYFTRIPVLQDPYPTRTREIATRSCTRGYGYTRTRTALLIMKIAIRKCIRAFDWYQNQRPWMLLNGHFALCLHNTCVYRSLP